MIWSKEMIENLAKLVNNYRIVSQRRERHIFLVDKKWLVNIRDMSYCPYDKLDNIRNDFMKEVPCDSS